MNDPLHRKERKGLGRLPLLLGITGHRRIPSRAVRKLEKRVGEFFDTLLVTCPHSPIYLMTSLADGADRLAARVALSKGIELVTVLPMPRSIYEKDFSSESKLAFDQLVDVSHSTIELPLLEGATEATVAPAGELRNRHYQQAGVYVVRHSQILLALWDGVQKNRTGGTSQIVGYQLNGVPGDGDPAVFPVRKVLDEPGTGPTISIYTPQDFPGHKTKKKEFCTEILWSSEYGRQVARHIPSPRERCIQTWRRIKVTRDKIYGEYEKALAPICLPLEGFNRATVRNSKYLVERASQSRNELLPDEDTGNLSNMLLNLRTYYGVADSLAVLFKIRNSKTLFWIYVMVFFAAVVFGTFAHLVPTWRVLAGYLLITLVTTVFVYGNSRWHEYQNRHQDYRALAEGLRVQFYWSLCRLNLSVVDHYLRKQKTELDWIRNAIRIWGAPEFENLKADGASTFYSNKSEGLNFAYKHWIKEQASWFTSRVTKENKNLKKLEHRSRYGLKLGLLIAISFVALAFSLRVWDIDFELELEGHHYWHGLLILSMSVPLVFAALIHNYGEKKALSEHIKQYGRMAALFQRAVTHIEGVIGNTLKIPNGEDDKFDEVLKELGIEALGESADWVMLHRERPVDTPYAV
jgi:hypothetical protein